MGKLSVQYRVLGLLNTNTYFLINQETKEGIVVDPADCADYIMRQFELREYTMKAIFLTHGHFDHIYAVNDLRDAAGVPVYAYADEERLLGDSYFNRSSVWAEGMTVKPDILVHDREHLQVAGFDIEVIHTPGHTAGSCCYYFAEDSVLIAGDTLFYESYGRTDLSTGSQDEMLHSLTEKLFLLPPETEVYPGHGDATTIEHELEYNPACFMM
ncbi:MAG: MBL fold metallo-hydrolase [Lachnospiraceae bacterium]|nr:MBL fold metallo-hydrolase [Candidatus Minthocola equi]